jgi:SAM-dependent methyltransferase
MQPPLIVDKPLLRQRLARALAGNARRSGAQGADAGATFLLDTVTDDLIERLDAVERHFDTAIAMMGVTGRRAAKLAASGKAGAIYRIERVPEAFSGAGGKAIAGLVGDEEALPLRTESVDLIVSPLALHWTNDLPGALVQMRRALKPDGLLLAALAGGGTLGELRFAMTQAEAELTGGASPRVMPFPDVREIGALMQRAGFALPVADCDLLTVRYATPMALFSDLKAMAATNVMTGRDRRPMPRRLLMRAAEIYAQTFADPDGRIRATFEIVSLSGWAPHASQQKPARRGSASVSLADALAPHGSKSDFEEDG